jgi:chlorobactene glucosyltransferase
MNAMWLLGAVVLYAAIVALALLRSVRQFRRYENLEPERLDAADAPRLAVIVPARNEAATVGSCLTGLAAQDYPREVLTLFAIDDVSTDGTPAILRRLAAHEPRLHLLETAALPEGWTGKNYACWRGALAAADADAEWLCFIDADTEAQPALLGSAMAFARRRALDMLSLEPFQKLSGFLDRLVIPEGLLAIAATQDLRQVTKADADHVPANGQFILVRAASYFAAGGHAAVRGEICEDSALAGRLKAAGAALALVGAERLIRTRMYANAREVWQGLSKNVTEVYGGSGPTLAIVAAGLLVGWGSLLLPLWAGIEAAQAPSLPVLGCFVLALLTSLAVYATQVALARNFRIPFWYGLLFPLSCTLGALIAINAVIWRGRGRVAWKGRFYTAPQSAARHH